MRLDAKSQKVVTGFHVAYHQSVCEQGTNILKVGARVIGECFMCGVFGHLVDCHFLA